MVVNMVVECSEYRFLPLIEVNYQFGSLKKLYFQFIFLQMVPNQTIISNIWFLTPNLSP